MRVLKAAALLLSVLFCGRAIAGELVLRNGDRLTGEIKAIHGEQLLWRSQVLGELTFEKHRIAYLNTSLSLKLVGFKVPCNWLGMKSEKVLLSCGGANHSIAFMTLDSLVPFVDHKQHSRVDRGKVTVVGTEGDGNVRSSDWLVEGLVEYRRGDFRHDVTSKYTRKFVRVNSVAGQVVNPVLEYYRLAYGLDWFFRPSWYALMDASADQDDAANIEKRYIFGFGGGFQWWENRRSAMKVEAGLQHTLEEYSSVLTQGTESQASQEFGSVRLATDFRYRFSQQVTLFNRSEFVQSASDGDDWQAKSETGVGMPLGFGVSAELNIQYAYDSIPNGLLEKRDTKLRVGLGYSW